MSRTQASQYVNIPMSYIYIYIIFIFLTYRFSANYRLQRVNPPLYGVDLSNMDHLIECITLLSFKSQTYLDRTVSCACLRWLNDILWLLYRDLNVCSVMPMYDFVSSLELAATVAL